MPTVKLTAQQRAEAHRKAQYTALSDGICTYKRRNHMTNEDIARICSINPATVTKIINEENVRLDMDKFWRLVDMAGLRLFKRKEDVE